MLGARGISEPTCERLCKARRCELARAERTVRGVEDGSEIDVDTGPVQAEACCATGGKCLRCTAIGACRDKRRQCTQRPHSSSLLVREPDMRGTREDPGTLRCHDNECSLLLRGQSDRGWRADGGDHRFDGTG